MFMRAVSPCDPNYVAVPVTSPERVAQKEKSWTEYVAKKHVETKRAAAKSVVPAATATPSKQEEHRDPSSQSRFIG